MENINFFLSGKKPSKDEEENAFPKQQQNSPGMLALFLSGGKRDLKNCKPIVTNAVKRCDILKK